MRRILIASGFTGICAFWAGKYLDEEETRARVQAEEQAKVNRNTHRPETIVPPFRRLSYPQYNILYSTYHKSPVAVHEHIKVELIKGEVPRNRYFFPDEQIKEKHFQVDQSFYAETEAFKRFNINRGHMAAAGNYSNSQVDKFHSFAFSNIIPQNGYNNCGIWGTFERYTRNLAVNPLCESLEVISGPIYLKNTPEGTQNAKVQTEKLIVLKQNGIPIPEKLYKIIKCNAKEKAYYNAFEFLNSQTYDNENSLEAYKVPLAKVELQTGLHFEISGGELSQIDASGLKSKKKEIDGDFYTRLISYSTSISEMNERYRSAKQQKIEISYDLFTDKIRELAKKDIALIDAEDILECERLKKLLRLNKKIFYLYHLDKTRDIREEKMEEIYNRCLLRKDSNSDEQATYQLLTQEMGTDLLKFIKK